MESYKPYDYGPRKPAQLQTGASSEYMAKVLGIKSVKSSMHKPAPVAPPRKKRAAPIDYDNEDEEAAAAAQLELGGITQKSPRKKKVKGGEQEEKRLRRYRQRPPKSYLERLERVRTQRMFLIERNRTMSADGTHEEEILDIAGSTGNVYQVTISKIPSCSCPDATFNGNQCKHIIYAVVNILKAPSNLAYQLAFLSTELKEIFDGAPITQQVLGGSDSLNTDTGGERKAVEGDCPVCVMPFEEGEDLVWCKAACGQNIHRDCFEQWQRSKPGQVVKCVYCRSTWKGELGDLGNKIKGGVKNADGYVNVASELGMSGERDMSSYHPFWVSQQQRRHGRW